MQRQLLDANAPDKRLVDTRVRSIRQRLGGLLRLRCPRCGEGKLFRGRFEMNDPCPICGLVFQREQGYFLGAMYISYGLASTILIPLFFLVQNLMRDWSPTAVFSVALLGYLPLVPTVFRYSRTIWIYFDRSGRSDELCAGFYEKSRQRPLP